ncbi:MAG: UPF0175 family protein [Verrucomicrobia bacterium]|nr:UPF0175 family protein [Verrucomicrobiota bacterium]
MQVTLELPDAVAERLGKNGTDVSRAVLEAVVLEQYRSGEISRGKLAELLNLDFWQSEEFLRQHSAALPVTVEDLEAERRATEQLASR